MRYNILGKLSLEREGVTRPWDSAQFQICIGVVFGKDSEAFSDSHYVLATASPSFGDDSSWGDPRHAQIPGPNLLVGSTVSDLFVRNHLKYAVCISIYMSIYSCFVILRMATF